MESLEEQKLFDTPLSRRRVTVLKVAYQLKDAKVAESTPDDVLASIENDDDIECHQHTKKRLITFEEDDPPFTPKKAKISQNAASPGGDNDGKAPTTTTRTTHRPIPMSWQTASDADKKLIQMRDAGSNWGDIRKMWKSEVGEEVGASTLPGRYTRMKLNFRCMKPSLEPGDDNRLLLAMIHLERRKWKIIAATMEELGASKKYTPEFLAEEAPKVIYAREHGTDVPPTTVAVAKNIEDETAEARERRNRLNSEAARIIEEVEGSYIALKNDKSEDKECEDSEGADSTGEEDAMNVD